MRFQCINWELKQQQRWQLWKRHLRSELIALPQTLSRLFRFYKFVKCWQIFLELNFKGLYQSSRKEKESCCLVFLSSTKSEIRHFHVVVVMQWQLRNVQKSIMQVQSCCFAILTLLLFCCSRYCCCRCCLSSLVILMRQCQARKLPLLQFRSVLCDSQIKLITNDELGSRCLKG